MLGKANPATITPKLKRALRKEVAIRLENLSLANKLHQNGTVVRKLLASDVYTKARSVCLFLSMPGEFDTGPIVRDIFQSGRKCYVPRVESAAEIKMLQAFSLEDIAAFPLNKYSIPEPDPNSGKDDSKAKRDDAMTILDVDLFLVPGVAFDGEFRRLGHGRGYYDRYLNEMERLLKNSNRKMPPLIGLAFSEQIVSSVPVEPHDRQLDGVMFVRSTESGSPDTDGAVGKRKRPDGDESNTILSMDARKSS
jgi:5-formyltetrahydrofolate cyclo-ligase